MGTGTRLKKKRRDPRPFVVVNGSPIYITHSLVKYMYSKGLVYKDYSEAYPNRYFVSSGKAPDFVQTSISLHNKQGRWWMSELQKGFDDK